MNRLTTLLTAAALCLGAACAHASPTPESGKAVAKAVPAPRPSSSAREPVTVARSAPAMVTLLKQARSEGKADAPNPGTPSVDETVTQIQLGGQCGFAGCSSQTLVAFTYRTRGANTATRTVLALVSCEPAGASPCTAVPAEVRATSPQNPTQ